MVNENIITTLFPSHVFVFPGLSCQCVRPQFYDLISVFHLQFLIFLIVYVVPIYLYFCATLGHFQQEFPKTGVLTVLYAI
jgi:hypothetical protein